MKKIYIIYKLNCRDMDFNIPTDYRYNILIFTNNKKLYDKFLKDRYIDKNETLCKTVRMVSSEYDEFKVKYRNNMLKYVEYVTYDRKTNVQYKVKILSTEMEKMNIEMYMESFWINKFDNIIPLDIINSNILKRTYMKSLMVLKYDNALKCSLEEIEWNATFGDDDGSGMFEFDELNLYIEMYKSNYR